MLSNAFEYDDTSLLYEEVNELYYLDKRDFIGKLLPETHETELADKMPDDYLYDVDEELLDTEDYEWALTYQFSSNTRNPLTPSGRPYGNYDMTFRRLYIILCEKFNMGDYFIDEYFKSVYPYTMKEQVEARLKSDKEGYLEMVSEMHGRITKAGRLDRRSRANKELEYLSQEVMQSDADEVAQWVKDDIKSCLATGIIPLNFNLSDVTIEYREALGLGGEPEFYATGRLIDDLRIFFRLEKKEWKTQTGIMV